MKAEERFRPSTCAAAPAAAWCSTSATCPRPGPARDARAPGRARQPRPLRPPARRPGRRHLVALEGRASSGRPTLPGADVDYTFAQVEVKTGVRRLQRATAATARRRSGRSRSTRGWWPRATARRSCASTTRTPRSSSWPTCRSPTARPRSSGDFELAGVAGRGARIALDFVEPGGAGTGRLLPTGRTRDLIAGVEALLRGRHERRRLRARARPRPHRRPRRRRRSTPTTT